MQKSLDSNKQEAICSKMSSLGQRSLILYYAQMFEHNTMVVDYQKEEDKHT